MTVHNNSNNNDNDCNVFSAPTPSTSSRYRRPHTMSRVQSNISAAARRRVRQIRRNRRTLIRNASTVLREVATNQINIQAEQDAIRAESQALVNSTNAATLSFNLRLQDLERTVGRVTHNVHFMFRRLNEWKNDIKPDTCSDELFDLRAATVDIVRNAAYLGNDGNDSDGDFNV